MSQYCGLDPLEESKRRVISDCRVEGVKSATETKATIIWLLPSLKKELKQRMDRPKGVDCPFVALVDVVSGPEGRFVR